MIAFYPMMMVDPMWFLFAIPGILLGFYAQVKLSSAYARYIREPVASGLSGAEAAREILDQAGLVNVPVEEVGGHLTDHYDPTRRALFLSSENFQSRSLAAVGVAAHEAGHALQHQAAYAPLKLRMIMVPATQFSTWALPAVIMAGYFLSGPWFSRCIGLAITIMAVITAFQLITLPVEYDASNRAKERLFSLGIVQNHERQAIGKVLNAAALTYVAAMIGSVMQLLHLIMLSQRRND